MNWLFIQGLIRHLLTFGGGALVAQGHIDPDQAEVATGAILSIGGVIWSAMEKRGR